MSRSTDLRALFGGGYDDMNAQEVFTNRHGEWSTVVRSLVNHAATTRAKQFRVDDFACPRRNVLVFYGVGGIGKTAFSKRLEAHLATGAATEQWPAVPAGVGRLVPIRIDVSRQGGVDFEDAILAIRLAVGRLDVPMRAFDLAMRRYWELTHPGEPLDGYLQRSGFLRRLSQAMALPEDMRVVMEDVAESLKLPTALGAAATTVVREIAKALRERRDAALALSRCTRLADLLDADPDIDTLSYFPHLLAWDLSQADPQKSGIPVILLDTFEEVGDRTHRDLERLYQRLVWLMPNALFVITGRNRLQWDDPRLEGQLDWAGPACWPQLAPTADREPRQHLVGFLSGEDRELYLSTRLTRNSVPAIPPTVRAEIAERSFGLPLYLDLAVMRFLDLLARTGRTPGPEEFQRDFPALLARIVRDLTPGERTVLRTVSLLDSFTVDLATDASGLRYDAAALNLIERPFIIHDPDAPLPYRLHDLLRATVRDADATTEDRWSPGDWRRAAQLTLTALGKQMPAGAHDRRQHLMSCLTQGLRLACEYDLEPAWLVDAAWTYVIESVWEPIELPDSTREQSNSSAAAALTRTLHATARGQRTHRHESARELTAILDLGVLPATAVDMARYYLGESERHLGHYEASARHMRLVAAGTSPLAGEARRGLTHIARHIGDFPAALEGIETLDHDTHYYRALGHLWWTQADIDRACTYFGTARRLALDNHNPGHAALAQAGLAFAAAFADPTRAAPQIELADKLLRQVQQNWSKTQVGTARLLRDAGLDDTIPTRAAELAHDAEHAGLGSALAYIRFALCYHHAIRGEQPQLDTARAELRRSTENGEYTFLLELTHFLDNSPPDPKLPPAQWINGADLTAQRWRQLLTARQAIAGFEPHTEPTTYD